MHQLYCTSPISRCLAFICCIPVWILFNISYSICLMSNYIWCHWVLSVIYLACLSGRVKCCCNAVQFITIVHTALLWGKLTSLWWHCTVLIHFQSILLRVSLFYDILYIIVRACVHEHFRIHYTLVICTALSCGHKIIVNMVKWSCAVFTKNFPGH